MQSSSSDHSDAIYIYFQKGRQSRSKEIAYNVVVDYNVKGEPLGMEILEENRNMNEKIEKLLQSDWYASQSDAVKEEIQKAKEKRA